MAPITAGVTPMTGNFPDGGNGPAMHAPQAGAASRKNGQGSALKSVYRAVYQRNAKIHCSPVQDTAGVKIVQGIDNHIRSGHKSRLHCPT